jgi:hypothetical protein
MAGWQRKFFDSIILPDGRKLLTLRDNAEHFTALPVTRRSRRWVAFGSIDKCRAATNLEPHLSHQRR